MLKRQMHANEEFAWQAGYGAFGQASLVEDMKKYIQNQQQHHQRMSFPEEFRELWRRHGLELDEQIRVGLGPSPLGLRVDNVRNPGLRQADNVSPCLRPGLRIRLSLRDGRTFFGGHIPFNHRSLGVRWFSLRTIRC